MLLIWWRQCIGVRRNRTAGNRTELGLDSRKMIKSSRSEPTLRWPLISVRPAISLKSPQWWIRATGGRSVVYLSTQTYNNITQPLWALVSRLEEQPATTKNCWGKQLFFCLCLFSHLLIFSVVSCRFLFFFTSSWSDWPIESDPRERTHDDGLVVACQFPCWRSL